MNKLKQLNEQRGAKLKEARAIFEKAAHEKRDCKDEEVAQIEGLQSEIAGLDKQIEIEVRQVALESERAPKLSPKEERDLERFDFGRLLRSLHRGTSIDGLEREMIDEGAREAQAASVNHRGLMLPRIVVRHREQRDMTATGTTATTGDQGGQTVATAKAGFYDAFFDALVLRGAGATVLEGLQGNLDLPRFVAPAAPTKKTENATADELSPTVATLSLSPKRLPAFIDVSDQLIMQSSTVIEAWIRRNLEAQTAAVAERAFIAGGGTSEPVGITGTTGIGSVVGGTNGAAPDWADIVNLESEVAIDNALLNNLHYLTNSKVRGKLKQTVRVSSTDSRFIWDGADLNGYAPVVTNAVPSTLTKGSASGICSALIFGNFADLVLAFWSGISIDLMRDVASAKDGKSVLVMNFYYDGGVVRPVSFAAMLDALTT